jgi:hypothetical protein
MKYQNKFYWTTHEFSKQVLLIYEWHLKTSSIDLRMKFQNVIYCSTYEIQNKLVWSTYEILLSNHRHIYHMHVKQPIYKLHNLGQLMHIAL